jgi:hypothetical protein
MDTSLFDDDVADFPVSCTLCLVQEGVIGTGWIWELSPVRCLIQSSLFASPGLVVKLSLQMPATAQIRMEGLGTWARESEFGMEWLRRPAVMNEKEVTV